MDAKRELDKLIAEGSEDALLAAARDARKRSKLLRRITAGLCSAEPREKWRAVFAMGVVAGEQGVEFGVLSERIRRFLWALNDESGDVPYGFPEALGEILAARPELRSEYISILVSFLAEEELVQTGPILAGAIWALGRAGVPERSELERTRPGLGAALGVGDPDVRGAALWAAARLGLVASLEREIRGLVDDGSAVCLLIDGVVQDMSVGALAGQVLAGRHSQQEGDHGLAVQREDDPPLHGRGPGEARNAPG